MSHDMSHECLQVMIHDLQTFFLGKFVCFKKDRAKNMLKKLC